MRLSPYLIIPSLALVAAGRVPAEIGGPSLGFVYDQSARTLRLISGIAGASTVGDPIDLGFPVAAAAVSARQDFALALDANSRELRLVRFEPGQAAAPAVAAAMPAVDRIALSAGGSSAALYRESAGRIQILSGLPQEPSIKREITLPEAIRVQSIAVSDDGELVIVVGDGAAWAALGAATPARLRPTGPVHAAAIRGGSHDTALASDGGRIFVGRGPDSTLTFEEIRISGGDSAQPLAIDFSPDGTRVHVVLQNGIVLSMDLQGGAVNRTSCRCTPSGLERLKPGSVFRLNDLSGGPVMLFDATLSSEPQVWFVPLPVPSEGGRQ